MRKKIVKLIAVFLSVNLIYQIGFPVIAFALTSGPSQPEFSSFEPVGTTDMVDLFSGDFNYNIPLLEVEGYPINISYHSGISMDQEASWVGLGWNINPGVINRGMRGMPDDFNGENIHKEFNMKNNVTVGVSAGGNVEVFGNESFGGGISMDLGMYYNNYRGVGLEASINATVSLGDRNKSSNTLGMDMGLSFNSADGMGFNAGLSYSYQVADGIKRSTNGVVSVGYSSNSRTGANSFSYGFKMDGMVQGTNTETGKEIWRPVLGYTNGGGRISFASPTYVPTINFPMSNNSLTLTVKTGPGIWGVLPNLQLKGYYTSQALAVNDLDIPAYGYLYSENADNNSLMDFNREKDGPYAKGKPNLPLANFTYDVYSVSGQGIGGVYRPYRSEVGTIYDNYCENDGHSYGLGLEIGTPPSPHFGVNASYTHSFSYEKQWDGSSNQFSDLLHFKNYRKESNDPSYENFCFKQAGEKTEIDNDFINDIGGFQAVRPEIQGSSDNAYLSRVITGNNNYRKDGYWRDLRKRQREKRTQVISFLTVNEADSTGIHKNLLSYGLNQLPVLKSNPYAPDTIQRDQNGSHIAEVTSLRPDGTRYIYGVPAYNTTQDEVSFNVNGCPNQDYNAGTVSYNSGSDDSKGNSRGIDHFYSKVHMPAYAYSYLLTDVLSTDYIDKTGDGATPDDYGTYVKFNYTKLYGSHSKNGNTPFKWRTPYGQAGTLPSNAVASYEAGYLSDSHDDKGSYTYGEKEIWYVHSIESKNYVAQFYLSDRNDGLGVLGNGGKQDNSQKLKKLDSIVLFARHDLMANGAAAIPIKAVHFVYNYTLCPGVENNSNTSDGKLTLVKLYFTYGKSRKGKLSPYVFNYNLANNPSYSYRGHDRWGSYMPNNGKWSITDFPYTDNSTLDANNRSINADNYAQAWSLTSINLPSGGTISIAYEADDYAYVQNKRAMQMFQITGIGNSSDNTAAGNTLYGPADGFSLLPEFKSNDYLFVTLPKAVHSKQEFHTLYLDSITSLYYKCLVHINSYVYSNQKEYEYVPGMATIADWGINDTLHAWIKLKSVGINDDGSGRQVPAISKTAWQFAKTNLPSKVYPGSDAFADGETVLQEIGSLCGFMAELSKILNGFYETLQIEGYADQVDLSRSWIRLDNPTFMKAGGGNRVKQLSISDNWDAMSGSSTAQAAQYGQVYDYTMDAPLGISQKKISSGVASYEPGIGADENPFFEMVGWQKDKNPGYDDYNIIKKPMGESFYPSPQVGYSQVTVSALGHPNVISTGYTQYQFYTAYDFPTIHDETDLQPEEYTPDLLDVLASLLSVKSKQAMTVSQGYVVELNDMHGKMHKQSVYSGTGKLVSSIEHFYHKDPHNANHLDNTVTVVDKFGYGRPATIGVETDMVADAREHYSYTFGINGGTNVDILIFPIIALPIPTGWPNLTIDESTFRSGVFTKVVNRYGIVDSTVAIDENSRITTNNLAFDGETGEVLLTKTLNAYNDPVYNFTYPAHWVHDGMDGAYRNIDAQCDNVKLKNGEIVSGSNMPFAPGDEVVVRETGDSIVKKFWVYQGGCSTRLIDRHGQLAFYNDTTAKYKHFSIKVTRSGRRNMQTVPVGSVTTKQNPLPLDNNGTGWLNFSQVLNASASVYTDHWGLFACGMNIDNGNRITGDKIGDVINPYIKGVRGMWRPLQNYVYVDDRVQPIPTDAQHEGTYSSFSQFWKRGPDDNMMPSPDLKHWTWTKYVSKYSPYGFEIENKDALGVFTAALYGYNNSFPLAVASNAKYKEIVYDGFEDYGTEKLVNLPQDSIAKIPHWPLYSQLTSTSISTTQHHTGQNSLKVAANAKNIVYVKLNLADSPVYANREAFYLYAIHPSECMPNFSPDTSKQYLVSAWVKKDASCPQAAYNDTLLSISFPGTSQPRVALKPHGHVIEGWQRIEGSFTIPFSANKVEFAFNAGSSDTYFDDFRVLPFKGEMKSYVYDPISLRLMADLDENNYATFYEYDSEGKLIRLKKETANGISTIKETRMNSPKIK